MRPRREGERLERLWPRRAGPALLSLVVLIILLLPGAFGQDDGGVGAETRLQYGRWVVTWVDTTGVAARARLREGDVIVAFDGSVPRARRHTDPGLELGAARTWGVLRRGVHLTLRPAWQNVPRAMSPDSLLLLCIALAFWATGVFVRLIKPGDALVRRFHYLCLTIAVALAFGPAAGADVLWSKTFDILSFALLPALFLAFFVSFAAGTPLVGRAALLVRSLYGGGAVTGGLLLIAGLAGSDWYDPLHTLLLVLLAVGFLGGLGALARGYVQPRAPHTRRQTRIVLLGVALAIVPLTVLCLIPESVGVPLLVRPQAAALSVIFLPLSVTYAILRRGLWDIALVGRALVHASMTLLLAGCYLIVLYQFEPIRAGRAVQGNPLLLLAFFAAVAATFIPVRDRVQQIVDHLLYGDRYDQARILRLLGAQLASVRPLDEVLAAVAEGLVGALDLRGVAILLRDHEGRLAVRAASGIYRDAALAASLLLHVGEELPRDGQAHADSGRWIALSARGEESGVIYLGPTISAAELGDAEVGLAETIANQAAVTVANALLVERLRAEVDELALLRDRLLRVQEDERKRLARDLHDGAYHTVLDMVRQAQLLARAPVSVGAAPASHEDKGLEALIERGRDAAHELQALYTALYPPQLVHLGLAAVLAYLARTTNRDEALVVRLDTDMFPAERRLPREVEETLYRVARQAIDNALRHGAAREATIRLAREECEDGEQVALTVRDDGRGFVVPTSLGALLRRNHLGIISMRERVEGVGGTFSLASSPGTGTEIRVRVPVPAASSGAPVNAREDEP